MNIPARELRFALNLEPDFDLGESGLSRQF